MVKKRSKTNREDRLQERNAKIQAKYTKLRNTQEFGVQKYSYERILAELAVEFYLSEVTIEKIILKAK